MHDRHLRQHIRHDQGNACAQKIRKNDRRSSQSNGVPAPQKQSNADGASDGHHGELPLAETAMKTFGLCLRKVASGSGRTGCTLEISHGPQRAPAR